MDINSFPYLTGYDKLNQKAFEIAVAIQKEISGIDNGEMKNFLTLLSGILNYQGFCAQQGAYKNISSIAENDFRDKLISFLSANPNIGGDITKESHLAEEGV